MKTITIITPKTNLLKSYFLLLLMLVMTGCEENELSDLLEEDATTDVDQTGDETDDETADLVTYENTVKAILDNACVQCHNATTANGGVRLHNYASAFSVANSGRMISRMTSTGSPMPPSGNLPDAIIQDILEWIEDGLLEN